MFTEIFWLRIVLSFIVGGLYIGGLTRLSERVGSKLGGLLLGMPSIVLIGLIFIAWNQNSVALAEATSIMPATIAASSIFLMAFILLYRFGLVKAYFAALAIWFALNLPLVLFKVTHIGIAIIIAVLLLSISTTFFHKQQHRTLPPFKLSRQAFLFRIAFSGALVALAVFISRFLGPIWGGLFASFPAAFSATVLILARTHGLEFTAAVSRTMVSGNLVNIIFVCGVNLLVVSLGSAAALAVAYLMCLLFAIFSYRYIVPRI